jgi:hypothetical protein
MSCVLLSKRSGSGDITTEATLNNLDANLLMWDVGRNINPDPMPPRRNTIQFIFNDSSPSERIVEPGNEVDLCLVDPGFDVDLYVSTDLRTMTEIWLGYASIGPASEDGRFVVIGNTNLAVDLRMWLKLGMFAKLDKKVA